MGDGPGKANTGVHDWAKRFTGVDPAKPKAPDAPAGMAPGAPQGAPSGGLPPPGSDKQSQEFHAALQQQLTAIDGHLSYTAEHAEAVKHQPLAARREVVAGAYQPTVAQVDPADEAKAKGAIDKALADAGALGKDVAAFRQAAEKAFNDWQARQPKYDEAVKQVGEMQAWGHAGAPPLQSSLDGIRPHVDGRAYAEACTAFDQVEPQTKPVWEDYQKQKAAQEQYEPARKALDPRLTAAATSRFKKLEAQQQAFGPATQEMDGAASSKDFVKALGLETALDGKVGEYEKALAELEKQQQAYEAEKATLQPKLDSCKQAPAHKKLDQMRQDLDASQAQMEQAAQAEDFDAALNMAKDAGTKADAYGQAVKELEEQKKAYDDAAAKVQPRLTEASTSKFKQLAPAQAEIADLQGKMEASATEEDYVAALGHANELSSKLDAYDASVKQIEEKKKQYEDASNALKPKLDAVGNPPHPKLKADEQAITDAKASMEKSAADEDYDSAAQVAGDLGGKADAYATAAKELEDKKKAYEEAWDKVKPRVDKMNSSRGDEAAPMQQEILSLSEKIGKAPETEEYDEAVKDIETLTRELDDYEAADDAKIYVIEYEGKRYAGTEKELVTLKAAITAAAIKKAYDPLKNSAEFHAGYCNSLKQLNDKSYVIAWVVEFAGGADFGTVTSAVAAQDAAVGSLHQAISGDPGKAEGAYRSAVDAVNAAGKALTTYMDKLDVGGSRTIAVLQAVEVTCFAIAAACGAAVLAPAGSGVLATMGANAASGAGFGALEEMAKQTGGAVTGVDSPKSLGDAALKVGKSALLNGVGGALGSGAGGALKGKVTAQIVRRAAIKNPVVEKEIEKFVEGAIGGAVQTLVSTAPDLFQGKTTWDQVAVAVAENMLAGGCGGIIGGQKSPGRGVSYGTTAAAAGVNTGVGVAGEKATRELNERRKQADARAQ